jgi:phosphatidylethanolamine/phosphatidyl-N-methylethanolamine N-methyltransferase
MRMTNHWNRIIYRLWAPVYDATVGHFFLPGRRRAIELLNLQPGERVLLVGVGTGADLPLLPPRVQAVGVDISPEMLKHAQARLPIPDREVILVRGDAQKLLVEESTFDAVLFNLILSVIPDGGACLRENLSALKSHGRAVVFDKFLPESGKLNFGRRFLNLFSTRLGTDITRRFGDLASGTACKVTADEPGILKGMYRVIVLREE